MVSAFVSTIMFCFSCFFRNNQVMSTQEEQGSRKGRTISYSFMCFPHIGNMNHGFTKNEDWIDLINEQLKVE